MPKNKMPVPSETQEQIWLFEWAEAMTAKYPALEMMFHVPNEGTQSKVRGHRLKLMGVKRGVPDIILPVPKGKYCGLAVELKSLKGKPSADQLIWIDRLRWHGWRAEICHGWQEAADVIEGYLHG